MESELAHVAVEPASDLSECMSLGHPGITEASRSLEHKVPICT